MSNSNEFKLPRQGVHCAPVLLQLQPKLFHATHVQAAKLYDLQHPFSLNIKSKYRYKIYTITKIHTHTYIYIYLYKIEGERTRKFITVANLISLSSPNRKDSSQMHKKHNLETALGITLKSQKVERTRSQNQRAS